MVRTSGRRAAKLAGSNNTAKPVPKTPSGPPKPFQYAPASLRPFLSTLPTDHVYLVHLDNTDVALKKRVFRVPVMLNITLILGLCLRIYFAAPVYLQQIITIFGYDTAYRVDTDKADMSEIVTTIGSRTLLLMVDYAIFALAGSWPKEFLFGGKSSRFTGPWQWRRKLGFKEIEIVVRRGRKWDTPLLTGDIPEQVKTWNVEDELRLNVKIEAAMRTNYIAKTGYLLLDKDWDLDFKGILDAHRLVDSGTIQLKDLQDIALVYYQKQWLIWYVHEEPMVTAKVEEQDTILQVFRNKLKELGAESVFFRWIEILQYQTSRPGGFTEGRQDEALRELKQLVEAKRVD
jgi:hypothetical protein